MAPAGYFFFASLSYSNMHADSVNYYYFQLHKALKKHVFPCRFPLFGGLCRNNIGNLKDSCIIIIILLSIHSSEQTKSTMICIQITTQIKHVRLIIIEYFLRKKKNNRDGFLWKLLCKLFTILFISSFFLCLTTLLT